MVEVTDQRVCNELHVLELSDKGNTLGEPKRDTTPGKYVIIGWNREHPSNINE